VDEERSHATDGITAWCRRPDPIRVVRFVVLLGGSPREKMSREEQPMVKHVSAVIVVSEKADAVAAFYRDKLGIPLQDEQHGGGGEVLHYGCNLARIAAPATRTTLPGTRR
jgi:hypothetical protein